MGLGKRMACVSLLTCTVGCSAVTHDEVGAEVAALHAAEAEADVGELLKQLPGISDVEELALEEEDQADPDVRVFTFTIEQLIDYKDPDLGTFELRVQLRHRSRRAPTVLSSTGYLLFSEIPRDSEPSFLLRANAITVEHRFFGPSVPFAGEDGEPSDDAWQYLTVRQAAADNHRVIETLKHIYKGPWLSTGASKGGMTSIYHYRFYPDDLDGVVAYVAPHSYGTRDPRYDAFLERVGDAACRDKITALQRDVLKRRREFLPEFRAAAQKQELTFEAIGTRAAFEHVVQEYRFAFWQYGVAADCETIPAPGGEPAEVLEKIFESVGPSLADDKTLRSVQSFAGYYYQGAVELGQYGPLEEPVADLIRYPGTYTVENYAVQVPSLKFNPETMIDIGKWVRNESEHIIFVYGENDPWSAGAYEIRDDHEIDDVIKLVVPGGNHGASLTDPDMPAESRAQAFQLLKAWTGVTPTLPEPAEPAAYSGKPRFQHLSPLLRSPR